jgi:flagellum-specific ATP synthase
MSAALLEHYFERLDTRSTVRWQGRVTHAAGTLIESEGPFCSVGECCQIESGGAIAQGEVIGFRGPKVLSMPLESPRGVRFGDRICTWGARPSLFVGDEMLGRVLDGQGNPLDGLPGYASRLERPVDGSAPLPLERVAIREPLGCGVRAVDAFMTCGRGQRMGIFGGSGVGKSTLIGMMARNTSADITVLALIGERGREVREFLEDALGDEGRRRSVVVVSTSDQSPLLRIRAALAATTIAEYFCLRGKHVLMVVDSLTRFAMAQREIGLAAGEPPTSKGYTPSVFSLLARLIERAGRFGSGSITAFYTVLMEGDDQQDPLVDAARSLLDGHIVLDRSLAARNQYPPIAINDSLSRLMSTVAATEHVRKANEVRALLACYRAAEDMIRIGAYQSGADAQLDRAIRMIPHLRSLLEQRPGDQAPMDATISQLLAVPS